MKKSLVFVFVIICCIAMFFSGCTGTLELKATNPDEQIAENENQRFQLVDTIVLKNENDLRISTVYIYYDTETMVMYQCCTRYGYGTDLSVMYNADGTVMLYEPAD